MKLRYLVPLLVFLLVFIAPSESNGQALFDLGTSEGYVPVNDSLRLHYRAIGSSQDTVVVLHGGPGMPSAYMQPDLRPLALSNALLFYDQRSAGESTLVTDTTRLHLRDYVRDLEALRLHFGMEQMTLLGHSWGPYIMAAYAMEHPERIERMLLVDPGPPAADPYLAQVDIMSRLDSLSAAKAAQASERWGATPDTTKQCWAYYSQVGEGFTSDPSYIHQMWGDPCNAPQATKLNPHTYHPRNVLFDPPSGEFDWTDELAQITAPTLIIHGQDDPWPVEGGRHWAEALSNAQFVVVEDAGHFPYVEQPHVFFPVAKAFLEGAWPVQIQEGAGAWPPAPEEASNDYARVWWEITAAHDRLEAAIQAQDAARAADNYTENAMFFAPTAPPIQGSRQIRAFFQDTFNKGVRSADFQTLDLEGGENRLVEGGRYTLRGEEGEILDMGKYLVAWKKVDGRWKAYRDMFNTSMETPSPLYEYDLGQ